MMHERDLLRSYDRADHMVRQVHDVTGVLNVRPAFQQLSASGGVWRSADRRETRLADMDDDHLFNTHRMVQKDPEKLGKDWVVVLEAEILRRRREGIVVARKYGPVRRILLNNLFAVYDPWRHLGCTEMDVVRSAHVEAGFETRPIRDPDLLPEDHPLEFRKWHAGRVRYFAELMLDTSYDPEPVVVTGSGLFRKDNRVLVDGHHRVVAARLVGRKYIRAACEGEETVIAYLRNLIPDPPAFRRWQEREEFVDQEPDYFWSY